MVKPATRTCYLHIGTMKAGSTTIQGFLHTFRDALQADGLDLPTFGQDDVFSGGMQLANSIEQEKKASLPVSQAWRWLDRHLDRTEGDLCVSRESFCRFFTERKNLRFVRKFFEQRGVKLKLIAYVRDTVGLYNANYTQQAKRFITKLNFDDWADGKIANPAKVHVNSELFSNILEQDDMEFVVRPLQNLGPNGLIGDFCQQIGRPAFDWSSFDETPFRNETPGARTMAASLVAARKLEEGIDAGRLVDLWPKRELGRQFRDLVARRGWDDQPYYGPGPEMAKKIEDRFAESNEQFAQRVWGKSWSDTVPSTAKRRCVYDFKTAPKAERDEIIDAVDAFLAQLVEGTAERRAIMNAPGVRRPGKVSAQFP